MAEMKLLKQIRIFLRQHPEYEPSMVELSAAIYILSCKMMGEKPKSELISHTIKHA